MCHADLEIITFNKVKGTPGPFPDFSVQQKCKNFWGGAGVEGGEAG